MKSGISEIVHIIPLGHEFDRAVRPFDTAAANHVYLITDSGDAGEGAENLPPKKEYVSRVIRYLKKKHIPADVVETDFSDMGEHFGKDSFWDKQSELTGIFVMGIWI